MSHDPPEEFPSPASQTAPVDEIVEEAEIGLDPADGVFPALAASSLEIVGIGGSAGGLEALMRFFRGISGKTGAAYVVVLHLSPKHQSTAGEILQRTTEMPVMQVSESVKVEPDHVYVISPGNHLAMSDGMLLVSAMEAPRGRLVAVDLFFRTLADSHGPKATAIVLSGGDGDGSIGLKRIKERGGLTIAQAPAEATHDGMPRSAIATGMVDWILPVDEMPARLAEYRENGHHLQLPPDEHPERKGGAVPIPNAEEALVEVLGFLRVHTGHDFHSYKRATILRRISRRMQVHGCASLADYLLLLRTHPEETGALLQDLLISVTNFFRDREAFAVLEEIIPSLFRDKGPTDQVRVWVVACATGEEAYSVAMMLCEYASLLPAPPQIQVFATDIDESAIAIARAGSYPETIAADVSEERLARFFSKEAGRFQVRRGVRELVLFALHDVLKDSPFSRLDVVSCRNLLIYLNRQAQQRAFDIFHFALRPQGTLFLGSSESAEDAAVLFAPVDKKQRLYTRRMANRISMVLPANPATSFHLHAQWPAPPPLPPVLPTQAAAPGQGQGLKAQGDVSWGELHLKVLERISPPSIIVNRLHDIVHLSESAGQFLKLSGGAPSTNLLKAAHPELRAGLRAAMLRAFKTGVAVELERATLEVDGSRRTLEITVYPAGDPARDFLLVVFRAQEGGGDAVPGPPREKLEDIKVVHQLEEELEQTRAHWHDMMEQYETSTEELKASNEELQAMNEELRSATEELETGREELQSINEELTAVNQELKSKVEEQGRANSDLQNLMAATNIATIFLDRELRIKRYTPSTVALFNLISSDIGRPLSDLTHHLDYPDIAADAERVLARLLVVEREVWHSDGRCFLARLLPYRNEEQIAGVVLTCVDISERKNAGDARRRLSEVVEASNEAIVSYDAEGLVTGWNSGAERMFGRSEAEMRGKPRSILDPPGFQAEEFAMTERVQAGESFASFDTVRLHKDGRLIDVSLTVSPLLGEDGAVTGGIEIAHDIGVRKRAVEELQARDELEAKVEERTRHLHERAQELRRRAAELTRSEQRERARMARLLHDHVQQLLVSAKMRLQSFQKKARADQDPELVALVSLMDESLESTRSLAVDLSPPALAEGLGPALEWLGGVWMMEKHGLEVELRLDHRIDAAGEEMRALLFLAVRELLFNVVKHAGVQRARVELVAQGQATLRLGVKDGGRGFDPGGLDQLPPTLSGFGLRAMSERIEILGGTLELRSEKGAGVEVIILAPRGPDLIPKRAVGANPD